MAIANIERAADQLSWTRWCVAGLVMLVLVLLRRFLLPVLIPGIGVLCWIIAYGLSGPIEDLAADVRNRDPRPIVAALAVFGLIAAAELVAIALLIFSFLRGDDAAPVLAFLVLVALGGTAWMLWRFAAGWRSIQHLRRETVTGFAVVMTQQPPTPTPPHFVLPPRPKR